jgi:hypothetical protein
LRRGYGEDIEKPRICLGPSEVLGERDWSHC